MRVLFATPRSPFPADEGDQLLAWEQIKRLGAQFEITLRKILEDTQGTARSVAKTLDQVEVGRERLRAPATAAEQALAPHEPVAEATSTDLYDEQEAASDAARGTGGP